MDAIIRRSITVTVEDPFTEYPDLNSVWSAFGSALGSVTGLVSHESAFRAYVRRGLEDFVADGVQHLELRVDLQERVCTAMDGDCAPLTPHQLTDLIGTEAEAFRAQHPSDFCGVRLIFSRPRDVEPQVRITRLIQKKDWTRSSQRSLDNTYCIVFPFRWSPTTSP